MGATICKYYQKFKLYVKKCFTYNSNNDTNINLPYKLKKNDDEIIKSDNQNNPKPDRKISDYVEENYMNKNTDNKSDENANNNTNFENNSKNDVKNNVKNVNIDLVKSNNCSSFSENDCNNECNNNDYNNDFKKSSDLDNNEKKKDFSSNSPI